MVGIYQVYYDKISGSRIDPDMIPYFNTRKNQFFENSVILDIWKSERFRKWDYCGVVSWRYGSKTGLTGEMLRHYTQVYPIIDVFNSPPSTYSKDQHPYSRKRAPLILELVRMIDARKILPFELYGFDTKGLKVWCNYWITRPEYYDKYCREYLAPMVEFLQNPDKEIAAIIRKPIEHRDNATFYTAVPFFLEGLFSVFCTREGLKTMTI